MERIIEFCIKNNNNNEEKKRKSNKCSGGRFRFYKNQKIRGILERRMVRRRGGERRRQNMKKRALKSFRNSLNAERGLFQDGGFGQRTKFSKRGRNETAAKTRWNTVKCFSAPDNPPQFSRQSMRDAANFKTKWTRRNEKENIEQFFFALFNRTYIYSLP